MSSLQKSEVDRGGLQSTSSEIQQWEGRGGKEIKGNCVGWGGGGGEGVFKECCWLTGWGNFTAMGAEEAI